MSVGDTTITLVGNLTDDPSDPLLKWASAKVVKMRRDQRGSAEITGIPAMSGSRNSLTCENIEVPARAPAVLPSHPCPQAAASDRSFPPLASSQRVVSSSLRIRSATSPSYAFPFSQRPARHRTLPTARARRSRGSASASAASSRRTEVYPRRKAAVRSCQSRVSRAPL